MIDKTSTAYAWSAITPSDTAYIEPTPTAIYVGTGGDIVAEGHDGAVATFSAVPGGSILEIQPRRILATGTTASNIVGLRNTG